MVTGAPLLCVGCRCRSVGKVVMDTPPLAPRRDKTRLGKWACEPRSCLEAKEAPCWLL
jgi:hypothetical protein